MEYFNKFFENKMTTLGNGEIAVCCPFPHKNPDGSTYFEKNPSAHINPEEDVFHCKVCNASHSETSFLAATQGIDYPSAQQILDRMRKNEGDAELWNRWEEKLEANQDLIRELKDLGIYSVRKELRLGYQGHGIAFPVFVYGELLDVRTYNQGETPKVKSNPGAKPNILPFDLWVDDDRDTLLCAGEKDMAIARAHGFNAITITGGEGTFPKLFKYSFKGRKVFIAYDNDGAGHNGAKTVAMHIKEAGGFPYIIDLSPFCPNEGEDIHDYFQKYHYTADDLKKLMEETPAFNEEDYEEVKNEVYPLVTLHEAKEPKWSNRLISSRVSVTAIFDETYEIPDFIEYHKYGVGERNNHKEEGWRGTWVLDENNYNDVFYLCDSGLKEQDILKNMNSFVKAHPSEPYLRKTIRSRRTVYKSVVTDDVETEMKEGEHQQPTELVVYSFQRLESGKKYRIYYKRYPHPYKAQQIFAVVSHAEDSDNTINNFRMTKDMKEQLKVFQAEDGKVKEKMEELAERAKAFCGVETRKELAWAVDLFFHTPLDFYFGKRKERAYLEPMIIGDNRTGKSQTAKRMQEMYELGVFTSLKTATKAGLIGGSDRSAHGFKTKLGVLPRNHKNAVIMEEVSEATDLISKLTEIRSSNKVRLERVNGSLTVDCKVRMLSISNPAKNHTGNIPVRQYPNGIKIISHLIGALEDIARYDFFLIVEKPDEYIDPTEEAKLEAFDKEAYKNRVRWIWSREPEQIIIDEEVQRYIVDRARKLNLQYDSNIGLFGAEAWKKVSRVSIATAAMLFSCSPDGEKVIVKKEHVDWATRFLINCYDNPIFKLKEFVEEERKYTTCNNHAIQALNGIYNQNPTLVKEMERSTDLTQAQLRAVSGLDNDKFVELFNRLAECYFFRWNGDKIIPSERFRKALTKINRDTYLKEVGNV